MSEKTVAGQSIRNWNGKPYHSLDYMLKQTFGEKVYKVTLNGGMSCPNRDGKLGSRGCIFCSAGGSGAFAADAALPTNIVLIFRHTRIRMHRSYTFERFLRRRSFILP